jgi:hypothetical protein
MAKRTRENGVKTTDYRHSQDHRPNIPPARIAGEAATAQLLAKYGSKADVVREFAHRLYTACERRKRAKDAGSYNALVRSWPEIARLAREGGLPRSEQAGLFDAEAE